MSTRHAARPVPARMIRALSVPIILVWLALTAVTNAVVPQLEAVGRQNSVSLSPHDAPALIAMKRLGSDFQQFNSDSIAMIVLEGDQPLGDDAHHYYDSLVHQLEQDTRHVEHVQNFWGDPITAAGSQSTDGKAAYVQVNLAGNQGETLATSRRWRKLGTAVARWPVPILAAAVAVALIGLLALPGYKTSYNDRHDMPADLPANIGYTAAERHFSAARMDPDILLVEAEIDDTQGTRDTPGRPVKATSAGF